MGMDTPTSTPTPDGATPDGATPDDAIPATGSTPDASAAADAVAAAAAEDLATLHLVRRVLHRLGDGVDPELRDAQAARAAAAAREAAGTGGERDGATVHALRPRSARALVRRAGQRPLVPAGLVAAALALVLVVRTTAGPDLPVLALGDLGPGLRGGGPEAASAMAADGREPAILPWFPVRYAFVLADGLTAPADRGPAWRLEPPADLAAEAARLAAVLGLPAPAPSEWDPASLFVQDGANGATLWVGASGDWSYSGAYAPVDPGCVVVEPRVVEPADGDDAGSAAGDAATSEPSGPDCPEPTPPAAVPDAERARVLAQELLARTGMPDVRITDVYADAWGAWVGGTVVVDGAPGDVGPWVGVGFGGDGEVLGANGTLARPVRLGEYPLVGLDDALDRLTEWFGGDAATPMPMPEEVEPAIEAPATTGEGRAATPVDPDAPVSEELAPPVSDEPASPDPEEPAADAPVLVDPMPDAPAEPETVTVVLVRVELVVSLLWTSDGQVLLVPHFRFHDADGGVWDVVAVADRYLAG